MWLLAHIMETTKMRSKSLYFASILALCLLATSCAEDIAPNEELRQGKPQPPDRGGCATITFDGVSDLADPIPEQWEDPRSGLSIRSLYNDPSRHLHFEDGDFLHNHGATCCSTPYRFEISDGFALGDAFTIRRATFSNLTGTHTFSSSGGAALVLTNDDNGTLEMPEEFSNITWFQWHVDGGSGEVDDIEICPAGPNICDMLDYENIGHIEFDSDEDECVAVPAKGNSDDVVIARESVGELMFRISDLDAEFALQNQQACTVLNQALQICKDGDFEPGDNKEDPNAASDTSATVQNRLCHPGAELYCKRHDPDDDVVFLPPGVPTTPRSSTVSEENYCTSQVPGNSDEGYSLEIPSPIPVWACDSGDREEIRRAYHAHCCLTDPNATPAQCEAVLEGTNDPTENWCNGGEEPFAWLNWNKNWNNPPPVVEPPVADCLDLPGCSATCYNVCRVANALRECVLPNLGTPEICDIEKTSVSQNGNGPGTIQAKGVRYSEIGDYCFRVVNLTSGTGAHSGGRAMDLNNYSSSGGPYNYGNLVQCPDSDVASCTNRERVPQADIPPKFVSIMEACGFDWGGRFVGASVGSEPANYEGCDPMHFELPPLEECG